MSEDLTLALKKNVVSRLKAERDKKLIEAKFEYAFQTLLQLNQILNKKEANIKLLDAKTAQLKEENNKLRAEIKFLNQKVTNIEALKEENMKFKIENQFVKENQNKLESILKEENKELKRKNKALEEKISKLTASATAGATAKVVPSQASANVNNLQPCGTTSLLDACKKNSLKGVKYWIFKDPSQLHLRHPNYNSTLLHITAQQGRPEIVEYLIQTGLSVNCRDDEKRTPLHLVASAGRRDIASVLIKYSAKINVLSDEGWTPLCYAAWAGNTPMCKFLIDSGALIDPPGAKELPYDLACEKGHVTLANELF